MLSVILIFLLFQALTATTFTTLLLKYAIEEREGWRIICGVGVFWVLSVASFGAVAILTRMLG